MLRALSAELEQFGVANKTNMNNEKSTSKSILEDALAALLPMVPVMDRSRSAELPIAQSFSHLSEVFRSEFADARASQRKLSTELEAKKAELKRVRSYLASSVYGTHLFLRQKWFPKDVEAIKRAQYTQCMAVVDVMEKLKEKYNKPQEDATEGLEAAAAEGREGGGRNNKGLRQKERDEGLSVSFCEKNKKEYGLMQGSSSHSKSEASGNRKSITPPAGSDDDEQEAAHKALANLRKASIIEEVYLTQAVCEGLAKASEEEEGEGTAEDAVGRGEQGDAAMNKDGTPAPAGNKSGLVTVELITKHLDRLHRECGKFSEEWKAHFPTRDPFEWNAEKAENLEKEIAKLQEAEVEVKGKMKKLAVVEADGQGVGELLKEMAQNQERGSSQSGWKEQLPKLPDLHEREVRTSNSLNLVSRVYKNAHFPRGQLDTSQERVIPQPAAQVFLKFLQQRAKLQSFIQTHGQKILEGRALSGNVGADVNLAVGEAVDLGLDVMSAVSGFGLLAQWGPGVLDKVGRDVELAGARAGPESGGATIAEPVAEELEKSFSGGGTMLPSFNYSSEGVIGNVAFKARLWSEGMSQQARREFATASLSKQRKVSGARSDENDFSFHEDVILRDLASVPFSNMYLRAEKWAESDVAVAKKKKQPSFAAQLLKNAGTGMKAAVQSLNPAAPYAGIGKKIFSEVATGQLTGSIVNAVKYYQEQQALPDLSEAQKRVVEERRKLQGKNEFSLSPAARNALRVVEQALGGLSGNGDSAFRENLIAGVAAMKPEELLARANQSWWLLQKGFELCLHRHLGATSSSSATGEDDEKLMDFVPTGDRDADMESFLNLRQDRRRAEIVAELESQHGTDVKFAKHFRGNTELASKLKNVVTSASGGGEGKKYVPPGGAESTNTSGSSFSTTGTSMAFFELRAYAEARAGEKNNDEEVLKMKNFEDELLALKRAELLEDELKEFQIQLQNDLHQLDKHLKGRDENSIDDQDHADSLLLELADAERQVDPYKEGWVWPYANRPDGSTLEDASLNRSIDAIMRKVWDWEREREQDEEAGRAEMADTDGRDVTMLEAAVKFVNEEFALDVDAAFLQRATLIDLRKGATGPRTATETEGVITPKDLQSKRNPSRHIILLRPRSPAGPHFYVLMANFKQHPFLQQQVLYARHHSLLTTPEETADVISRDQALSQFEKAVKQEMLAPLNDLLTLFHESVTLTKTAFQPSRSMKNGAYVSREKLFSGVKAAEERQQLDGLGSDYSNLGKLALDVLTARSDRAGGRGGSGESISILERLVLSWAVRHDGVNKKTKKQERDQGKPKPSPFRAIDGSRWSVRTVPQQSIPGGATRPAEVMPEVSTVVGALGAASTPAASGDESAAATLLAQTEKVLFDEDCGRDHKSMASAKLETLILVQMKEKDEHEEHFQEPLVSKNAEERSSAVFSGMRDELGSMKSLVDLVVDGDEDDEASNVNKSTTKASRYFPPLLSPQQTRSADFFIALMAEFFARKENPKASSEEEKFFDTYIREEILAAITKVETRGRVWMRKMRFTLIYKERLRLAKAEIEKQRMLQLDTLEQEQRLVQTESERKMWSEVAKFSLWMQMKPESMKRVMLLFLEYQLKAVQKLRSEYMMEAREKLAAVDLTQPRAFLWTHLYKNQRWIPWQGERGEGRAASSSDVAANTWMQPGATAIAGATVEASKTIQGEGMLLGYEDAEAHQWGANGECEGNATQADGNLCETRNDRVVAFGDILSAREILEVVEGIQISGASVTAWQKQMFEAWNTIRKAKDENNAETKPNGYEGGYYAVRAVEGERALLPMFLLTERSERWRAAALLAKLVDSDAAARTEGVAEIASLFMRELLLAQPENQPENSNGSVEKFRAERHKLLHFLPQLSSRNFERRFDHEITPSALVGTDVFAAIDDFQRSVTAKEEEKRDPPEQLFFDEVKSVSGRSCDLEDVTELPLERSFLGNCAHLQRGAKALIADWQEYMRRVLEFKNRGRCVVPMSSVDLPTADPRFLGAVENEVGSMSSARRQAANSVAEDVQRMYSSVSAGLESVGVGGRGAQTPELIAFNDDKLNKHYFMLKWGLRLRKTGLGPASAQELKKSFPAPATEIRVTVPTRSDLQIPPEVSEHLFNPQSKSRLEDKTGLVTEEAASLWQATRHSDVRQLPEPGFAKGERVLVLDVEAEAAAKEDGRAVWPVWEGGVIQRGKQQQRSQVEIDADVDEHCPAGTDLVEIVDISEDFAIKVRPPTETTNSPTSASSSLSTRTIEDPSVELSPLVDPTLVKSLENDPDFDKKSAPPAQLVDRMREYMHTPEAALEEKRRIVRRSILFLGGRGTAFDITQHTGRRLLSGGAGRGRGANTVEWRVVKGDYLREIEFQLPMSRLEPGDKVTTFPFSRQTLSELVEAGAFGKDRVLQRGSASTAVTGSEVVLQGRSPADQEYITDEIVLVPPGTATTSGPKPEPLPLSQLSCMGGPCAGWANGFSEDAGKLYTSMRLVQGFRLAFLEHGGDRPGAEHERFTPAGADQISAEKFSDRLALRERFRVTEEGQLRNIVFAASLSGEGGRGRAAAKEIATAIETAAKAMHGGQQDESGLLRKVRHWRRMNRQLTVPKEDIPHFLKKLFAQEADIFDNPAINSKTRVALKAWLDDGKVLEKYGEQKTLEKAQLELSPKRRRKRKKEAPLASLVFTEAERWNAKDRLLPESIDMWLDASKLTVKEAWRLFSLGATRLEVAVGEGEGARTEEISFPDGVGVKVNEDNSDWHWMWLLERDDANEAGRTFTAADLNPYEELRRGTDGEAIGRAKKRAEALTADVNDAKDRLEDNSKTWRGKIRIRVTRLDAYARPARTSEEFDTVVTENYTKNIVSSFFASSWIGDQWPNTRIEEARDRIKEHEESYADFRTKFLPSLGRTAGQSKSFSVPEPAAHLKNKHAKVLAAKVRVPLEILPKKVEDENKTYFEIVKNALFAAPDEKAEAKTKAEAATRTYGADLVLPLRDKKDEVTVAITRTYTQKGTNKANFSAAEVFKLLADGRFVESSGEFMALTAEGAETIGAHARVSEKDGGEPEFLGGIHKGDEVLEFDLLVPIAARSSPLRPEIRFGAVSTTADVDANEPRKREAEFRERLSEKITKLQLSPRVLRFLTQPPILHFKSALRNDLYIPSKAPPPLTPDFDEESKEELRKMHDRMAKLREENSDLDEKIDKSRKKELELKTRQENLLKKLAERMASAKVRAARGQFLWNLRRFLSSVESDLFRFEAARAESGNSLLADFRQKILEKHVPRSSSTSTTTSTAVVTTHGDQAPPATLPENVPLAPISTSPCGDYESCWMDWLLQSDAWNWFPFVYRNEGDAHKVRSLRWREETRERVSHKDGVHAVEVTPDQAELLKKKAAAEFPRRGAKNPAQNPNLFSRLPFHLFEGIDPDMVQQILVASVKRYSKRGGAGNVKALTRIKSWKKWYMEEYKPLLHEWLNEREKEYCLKYSLVPTQNVSSVWLGTFFGHPQSMKVLTTERPPAIGGETSKAFPVEDSGGMGIRDSPAPRPAGTAAVDGATEAPDEGKALLYTTQMNKEIQNKVKDQISRLVMDAFFTQDYTEEVSHILHSRLGGARFLEAHFTAGANASKRNVAQQQAATTTNDLRKSNPRARFVVSGALSGPHSSRDTGSSLPHRHIRYSDVLNRLRQETVQKVDAEILEWMRSTCLPQLHSVEADGMRQKVFKVLENVLRGEQMDYEIPGANKQTSTALSLGAAGRATKERSSTCIATQYWVGPMRSPRSSYAPLGSASSSLDEAPASEYRFAFAPKPKDPQNPYEGFFVQAVPTKNADGGESVKLQLQDYFSEGSDNKNDSNYKGSFEDKAQKSFIKRAAEMEEKFRRETALASSSEAAPDAAGAARQDFAENKFWKELERLLLVSGDEPVDISDEGPVQVQPRDVAKHLFGWCFSLSAFPSFMQELLKERTQVFYARNYPVTHAPEHKTKFPGERHRLGVHVLEDPERSPFRLVPHDWSNAGDGATGSDLKVWEGVSQSDSSAYRAASSVTPPARSAGDESMAKEVLEKCVPAYASMIGGGGTAHKIAWNQVDAFGRDTDNFSEKLLHKGGSDGIYVDGKNVRCRSSSRGTEQREKKDDVDEKLLLLNQFGHMALFDALEIELDAIVYELVEEIEVKNAEVFYWDADDRIPGVSVTLAEISSLRVGIPLDTHTNAKSDKSASSGSAPLSGAAAGRAVEGSAMRNYLQHGMPQFLELSDRGNSSGHCTCGVEGDSSVCSGNSEMSSKNLWKHVPLKYMTPWVGSTKCDKGRRDCKQTEENEKQLATNRPENGQNIFVECPEPDPVAAKGALPHAASELGEAVVGNVGVCRAIRDLFKSNSGGKKGCFAHHMLAERYRKTLPDKIRNSTSCPSVRAPTTSTSTTTTTTADEFDLTHFRLLPVSISTAGKRKVDHLQYRLYNYPKLTDFQKRARGMAVEGKPEAPYYVDGTPSAAARTGRGSTSIDEEVPPFRLKRDSSGPVVLRGSKPMAPPGMITVDLTKPRDENEHYLQSLRIRAAPELEEFPVASKESAYADWYKITHVEQDASRLWNYYPFYNFSKRPLMKSSSGGADAAKDKSMQQILQWELEQAGGNLNEAGEATECASGDPKCMNSVQYIRATSGPDKRDTRLRATASAKPGSHGLDGLHGQHAGNLRIRIRHANRYRYSYAEGAISPEGGGPASRTPVDDEKNLSSRCPLLPYFAGRDAVGGVASPESARPLSASGHADESAQKAALAEYTRRRDLIFAAIPAAECDNILEINTSGGSGTGGQIGGFGDNAEPAAQPHGRSGDDVIEGKGTAQDDFHLYMAGSLKATEFFNDIANSNAGAVESGRNKKQELYKDLKERKAAQQEAKNKAKYWPRSFEIEWPAGEGEGGDKNSWLRPPKPCFWELNLAAGAFASLVAWYRVSNPLGAMAAGSALSAALCAAAPHVFAAYLAYQSWTTWSQVRGENFYNMTIGSLGQKAVGGVLDLTASPITRFFGPRFSLLSAAIDAEKHGHSPTDGTRGGYFHDFHVAIVRGEFGSVGATGSAGLPGSAGKPGRGGKAAEFELTIAPRDESSSVPVDVDSESLALFPQSETENNGAQLVIPSLLGAGGSDTPGRDGFDAIRISTAGTWVANNAEENRFQNVLEEVDLEFLAKNFPNAAAGAGQRSTAWSKREDTASLGVWAFSRFSQLGIAVGVPIGLAVAVAHVGIPLTAVAEAVFLTGATIAAIASTVAVSYDALNVLAKDLDTEIEVFVLPETAKTDYAAKTGGPGPGDGGGPTAGALGGGKSTDLLFHDEVAPHIGALRANKWLPLQDAMHNKRRGDQRLAGKRKLANRENRQNVVATERSDSSLATEQQNQADWSSQKQRSSERTSEDDAENEQNLDRTITSLQEKVSQRSINASAIEQLTEESTQFSEMSRSAQLFGTHAEALSQTEQAIREKSEIGARIGAMSVGNRVLAQLGGTVSAEVASATRRAAEQQRGRARRACVAAAEGLQRVTHGVLD
eukprot:g3417.t1